MTVGNQPVLQLHPTEPGHLQVRDEARRVVQALGIKKLFGRGKRGREVAERAHQTLRRLPDGLIVIYN